MKLSRPIAGEESRGRGLLYGGAGASSPQARTAAAPAAPDPQGFQVLVSGQTRRLAAFPIVLGACVLSALLAAIGMQTMALCSALCLTALILAPFLARAQFQGLKLSAPAALTVVADAEFHLPLPICRQSAFGTSRDILFSVELGKPIRDAALAKRPIGYLAQLKGNASGVVQCACKVSERGRHSSMRAVLSSSFPFALTEHERQCELPLDLLVLPRLGSLRGLDEAIAHAAGEADRSSRRSLVAGEFYGLREWRVGQSLRNVHWKLSARRGRVLQRELRGEDEPRVHIVLLCQVGSGFHPQRRHPSFERAVSLAATVGEHLMRRERRTRFTCLGEECSGLNELRGVRGLFPFLATLAEVRACSGAPLEQIDKALALARREVTIVICAAGAEPLPAPQRGLMVLDVDVPTTGELFELARPAGVQLPHAGALESWGQSTS